MESFKPISESGYIKNPGYLKLDLMLRGIRVDGHLSQMGDPENGLIHLVLPRQTHVSAPYQGEIKSPYRLRRMRGRTYVTDAHGSLAVGVIAPPACYGKNIHSHIKLEQLAEVYGHMVSIALGGHRYLQPHFHSGAGPFDPHRVVLPTDLVNVLDLIRRERRIDVVTLSAWETSGEDGGIAQIEAYIRAIKKAMNVLVFIEIHLPQTTAWIDRTYAVGADSVCYHLGNLCHHGDHECKKGPSVVEKELELLKHAVATYPPGTVLSHVTMGSRPFDEVFEDLDILTGIKVLPILTVENSTVVREKNLTTEILAPAFGYVYDAAHRNRIKMNWFSRMGPFIAPIEGRFFSGHVPRMRLTLMNFYQSRFLGGSVSSVLSNLRRKLRVREE